MEIEILRSIGELHNPFLDNFFIFFTKIGNLGMIWIFIAFIFLLRKSTRNYGYVLLLILFVNLIVGEGVLKNILNRGRPFEVFSFDLLIENPKTSSFPSGHTASSFAALGVFIFYIKKWIFPIAFLSIMISLSRLYLQVHYPTDVIAGGILGILVAYIVIKILKKHKFFTIDKL